jgi:hypothetical protein
MALANYTDLIASVGTWLKRTDLADQVPDFVTLAEARLARDLRIRKMVTSVALPTVSGTQAVTLPSDWLETENVTLSGETPTNLSVVTPEMMDIRYPDGVRTGKPAVYCILGDEMQLGPTPDGVYTITLDYYARFPALSVASTNWLLTNHPSLYLFASLAEASVYTLEDDRAQLWEAKYRVEMQALQASDDAALRSGSSMRVRYV